MKQHWVGGLLTYLVTHAYFATCRNFFVQVWRCSLTLRSFRTLVSEENRRVSEEKFPKNTQSFRRSLLSCRRLVSTEPFPKKAVKFPKIEAGGNLSRKRSEELVQAGPECHKWFAHESIYQSSQTGYHTARNSNVRPKDWWLVPCCSPKLNMLTWVFFEAPPLLVPVAQRRPKLSAQAAERRKTEQETRSQQGRVGKTIYFMLYIGHES